MKPHMAYLPLVLFLTLLGASASPASTPLAMRVGQIEERYAVRTLAPSERFTTHVLLPPRTHDLLLTWIVPDDLEGHLYDLELEANGVSVLRRQGTTRGFGRRSFFVPLRSPRLRGARKLSLVLTNRSGEPLHLEALRPLPDFEAWLTTPPPPDDFTLSLMMDDALASSPVFTEIPKLRSVAGIRKAYGREIHYAAKPKQKIAELLDALRECSEKHQLPFVACTCSWWAGTPPEVRQRRDFQQVCWSESDQMDEGPELKALLGERWDLRYGWSTPNMWSSTPWQTMNSAELNALRHRRMARAVALIEERMKKWLVGYVAENEPAYWAWEAADYKYPVKRVSPWADFNPQTVEAARADGVALDPEDGLSVKERLWLHDNLNRYQQANIDCLTSAGASAPLYSHALLAQMFPMQGTGHYRPYADTGRVRGAQLGLETLWRMELDALWRVREWGPWGCVNREENDGTGLEYHIAMLQAEYMLGANLFNSYNWISINQEGRATGYFDAFLKSVEENAAVAGARSGGQQWTSAAGGCWPLAVRQEFPWSNTLELRLRASQATSAPLGVRLSVGLSGPTVAWRLVEPEEANAQGWTRIDLGDLTWFAQDSPVTLHFEQGEGWEVLTSEDGPDFRLLCDLRRERRRSQYLIEQAQ